MSAIHRSLPLLPVGMLLFAGCADITGPGSRIAAALDPTACTVGTLGFDDYSLGWPTRDGASSQPAFALTPASVAPTDVELLPGGADVRITAACPAGFTPPPVNRGTAPAPTHETRPEGATPQPTTPL